MCFSRDLLLIRENRSWSTSCRREKIGKNFFSNFFRNFEISKIFVRCFLLSCPFEAVFWSFFLNNNYKTNINSTVVESPVKKIRIFFQNFFSGRKKNNFFLNFSLVFDIFVCFLSVFVSDAVLSLIKQVFET